MLLLSLFGFRVLCLNYGKRRCKTVASDQLHTNQHTHTQLMRIIDSYSERRGFVILSWLDYASYVYTHMSIFCLCYVRARVYDLKSGSEISIPKGIHAYIYLILMLYSYLCR